MQVTFQLPEGALSPRPVALTVGNFDGVHRGHRRLIDQLVATARDMDGEAVVLTFDPHPRCVLRPGECPAALTTLDEKRDLLERAGVDRLVVLSFSREVSLWSAEYFCDLLLAAFNLRHLVVGHDFALGHQRKGDVAFLTGYGSRHGFDVSTVAAITDAEEPVSSTGVRAALYDGDVVRAARLLGHLYFVDAAVEHGQELGRTLGFPTANLSITGNKCLPARGVYSMWVRVGEDWHRAATNVGYRPTFGGDRLMVEAYLLDFDADLYHQRLRAAFHSRLRDELTYDTPEALIRQMERDVAASRHLLRGDAPADLG